jgi:hypothetical protein
MIPFYVHVLYFIINIIIFITIIIIIIIIAVIITMIITALGGCENITKKGTVRTVSWRCFIPYA